YLTQGARGVAAAMAQQLVVAAPEPGIGRHRHEEATARREEAPARGEGGGLVVEVLEHVEEADRIPAGGLERDRIRQGALPHVEAALAGALAERAIRLDAHRGP